MKKSSGGREVWIVEKGLEKFSAVLRGIVFWE